MSDWAREWVDGILENKAVDEEYAHMIRVEVMELVGVLRQQIKARDDLLRTMRDMIKRMERDLDEAGIR